MYDYSDLFNAGQKVNPYFHTKKEIVLHFPELPILQVWDTPHFWLDSFDTVHSQFINGQLSNELYNAYCAIWRNSIRRLSSTCSEWEF